MLRWINLGLGLLLATLLLMELGRSDAPEPVGPVIQESPPRVVQETPGRRARRAEQRAVLEERRREQRERATRPAGPVELDASGQPIMD